jgi:hypothetical protein
MSTLYLHIGHDKTGTSFLQSAFANSEDIFERAGIEYPMVESMRLARQGEVSEGNGYLLKELFHSKDVNKHHFYSSEMIFQHILKETPGKTNGDNYLSQVQNLIEGPLFDTTKVLLFIRDPIAHTISHYQQMVKRGGMNRDVNTYFSFMVKDGITLPARARSVIEFFKSLKKCDLTIYNYSKGGNILELTATWLGLQEAFHPPENQKVNRSLSEAELRMQIATNKRFGVVIPSLSDFFVNRFPELNPRKVYPDLDIQQKLIERCRADMEWINQFVSPGNTYHEDLKAPVAYDNPDFLRNRHYEIIADWFKLILDQQNLPLKEEYKIQNDKQENPSAKSPKKSFLKSLFHNLKKSYSE